MTTMIRHIFVFLLQFTCLESLEVKQTIHSVIPTNGNHSCPQPTVGNCSCKLIGPYVKVNCVGLDAVPKKVPENTIYLTFFNGTIKEIPQKYFSPLKNLYTLDLGFNKISNKFYLPKTIMTLQLSHNNLNASTIFGMLDGLTRLRSLDLSNNPLGKKLVPGTFSSITKVNEFRLENCSLEDLGENMFSGLTNLRNMTVILNKVRTLRKGALRGISCPKGETSLILEISGNQIYQVEDGAFEGVHGVSRLNLANNQLSSIPDLTGLSDVTSLNFANNSIVNVSSLTLSNVRSLHSVGNYFPMLQRMACQWYKQFMRRLTRRFNVKNPWKVLLEANVPRELFGIVREITARTNFGVYTGETRSKKAKKYVMAFTSEARVRSLFSKLMDLEIPSNEFLRKVTKDKKRIEAIINEDKQFGMMYDDKKEILSFDFFYGIWNSHGVPQHI